MKIGSLELSISTFVYALILVVILFMVPVVAMSKWAQMREAWHRSTILNAMAEGGDSVDSGIAACQALIAADGSKAAPRMYLGCLYCLNKNYKDAQEAFDHVQDAAKATPEEKSLALTAEGCAACLAGEKDGKPGNLELAEGLFKKALEVKETPDALGAMALLKSWKSEAEAEPFVNKAFVAEPAPSLAMLEQLYRLQGSILAHHHKPGEAGAAFGSVKALNPGNATMDDAARFATLASINEPGLDSAARRTAIEKMTMESSKFGKAEGDALLAIGMAWLSLKKDPEYAATNGPFDRARLTFRQMLDRNPKDARAYKCLAAMLSERAETLSAELTVPVTGINGEAPHASTSWTAPAAGAEHAQPERYSKEDQTRVNTILALNRDEDAMWERMLRQSDVAKEDKIDAKIRMLACVRRQIWLTDAEAGQHEALVKRAVEIAGELVALDASGRSHQLQALVLIDKGDLAGARASLLEAAKRGPLTPESTKLLAELDVKAKLIDVGPAPAIEREFGAAPLIRATVETPLGLSALKNIKVTMNEKQVPATVFGTQILYLPSEADMSGGPKTVQIVAGDSTGSHLEFPKFTFLIDKEPPTWAIDPPAGAVKGDVVFSINLKDESGVDWGTLSAGMRSTKTTAEAPFDVVFVRDGHFSHALPRLNVKTGELVLRSPFKLTAPTETIPSGEYKVWIEVKDVLGNKLKDEKIYTVVK